MKKLILSLVILLPMLAMAQDLTDAQKSVMNAAQAINNTEVKAPAAPKPNYWKRSFNFDLGFNQAALVNWAAGGYATIGLSAAIDGKANYAKDLMKWDNRLQLNYGFVWSADKANLLQSSNDRIYLESRWAYNMSEKSKFAYSAGLDFKTQFYDVKDKYTQNAETGKWDGVLKSTFFAPAYINLALGIDWDPCNWLDLSLAPLTGGVVIVGKEELRKNYGMDLLTENTYRSARWSLGAQLKANAKVAVNDWFVYETQLVLFADYLRMNAAKYPDKDWYRINWDNKISFNVAKYFKIGLQTWLIYDPVVTYVNPEGVAKKGPVQFKEALSINFTYTIANKK